MSLEENKALVRRIYEEAGTRAIPSSCTRSLPTTTCGTTCARPRRSQKKVADDFRAAFPDLRVTVDLIIGEEDFVVGRWTASGTHLGSWGALEPTGRLATFSAANIYRFENGKVAEIWNHRDDFGLTEQIGSVVYAGARPGDG